MIAHTARQLHAHIRKHALLLACLVALVVPAVAAATTVNYCTNVSLVPNDYRATSGSAQRSYNEVWRPSGINFSLFYNDGQERKTGTVNPLLDSRSSIGAAVAGCQNIGSVTANPVTCQTTT